MTLPLAGLKVLDLTRLLPGPYLSLLFADMGADVIKVEAPQGGDWVRFLPPQHGGMSVHFIGLNRSKRSIALNLKKPGGADVLKKLVEGADVLLESFRPGVMDRLGVGYEALRAVNPRLVYASVTGYGQTGPYRDRAGHDLNYCALGGSLAMTGKEGGPPQMAGFQLADVAGGGLFGMVGVLAALHARSTTGEGRFVDVSMTEGAMAFNVLTMATTLHGSEQPTRGTDRLNGSAACYGVYETKDGGYMTLAALEPKFWSAFCEAVDKPDWRRRHMGQDAAMKVEIAALFKTRTRENWTALFADRDACVEPVLELAELPEHPQHVARDAFFSMKQTGADEPLRQYKTPVMQPGDEQHIGPAPRLGEHTVAVLTEAGYSDEQVAELLSSAVVSRL